MLKVYTRLSTHYLKQQPARGTLYSIYIQNRASFLLFPHYFGRAMPL